MKEKISEIKELFAKDMATVSDEKSLEELRIHYFSKKGSVTKLFDELKDIPKEEKPLLGKLLNELKNFTQNEFDSKKEQIRKDSKKLADTFDHTLPGRKPKLGSTHIITQTLNEVKNFFMGLGFSVSEGPELESDFYNFGALNFPDYHPARDMQDTFFINKDFLLRTHTSPVQVRLMLNQKPPLRSIMPGKVYRNESLSAKSYCLFHQVEGLFVDKDVTFTELKGTLVAFAKHFFGSDVQYRFRPSFFPFTEPSAEMDIWWKPKGKEGRWLEILGCGMVDPNVFKNVGIDPEIYTGYAFGMGVERMALRKYGINDIRILFDNDKRFLEQF
ncbi:MAG: phenylalanine--tRNA ligase subunit alpha [bacterium]